MVHFGSQQVDELLRSSPGAAVYLIGVGGCGVSGLGHLLLDLEHRVAGSDLIINEECRALMARGAEIQAGHSADHLAAARPALVVYSSAIRHDNPQLRIARELGIPVVRRAVLLAALVHRQRGVCVAGMHGKTTTTALLAFVLERLNARPSYAVGALVPQFGRHARFSLSAPAAGVQPLFVFEADESDGTLQEFHPEQAILLNVDEEHLDHYANFEGVCAAFGRFAAQTRGPLLFCADDLRLAGLLAGHPRAISYGFAPQADYRLALKPPGTSAPGLTSFEVWHAGGKLGDFATALLGEKNVSNAGAVIAMSHQFGYSAAAIAPALAAFTGAARRQQRLFADERFQLFEDYGHHPAEIEATLQALKSLRPRRLLVAFQPHRFTRTQFLLRQFATCFGAADHLWLTEVYAASEPEIAGVNGRRLAEAVRQTGQKLDYVSALTELPAAVRAAMLPGDLVLFIGAGDITNAARQLADRLRRNGGTSVLGEQQARTELNF